MNVIVFDIEATCWREMPPSFVQETIEIGAYLLDSYFDVQDKFDRFIKPVKHPYLSSFCKELTSISQQTIDRAKSFPVVIDDFQTWSYIGEEEYVLCSWGDFDKRLLSNDCLLHRLDNRWLSRHVNLKKQYQQIKRLKEPIGLKNAVEREGFDFSGTHHRGIDDAFNLVKIFLKYRENWNLW